MEQVTETNNTIFEMEPTLIKVHSELPRQRKDLGEIHKLAESIKTYGQLLPIVINRNNELIAGGRRLAACLLIGQKAKVIYKDTADKVLMRELELEENIQRKELTPAEYGLAVDELVKLKQEKYGIPVSGKKGGFTLDDAAELIGKTRGSVIDAMQIAEAVRMFPNLAECKTKSEIKKAVKGLERVQKQVEALASYDETVKHNDQYILVNKDALDYLSGVGDGTVDLFFTDPPYGISVHDLTIGLGGHTGGEVTSTGITYEDSEEYAKSLLERLAVESYRVTKDTGHALVFCAPSHFPWLSERMAAAGWLVAPRPVIWIKRETGQNNQPEKWFSAAYEFILYARKPNSTLAVQGRPDWIQCDPVVPSARVHQAEKPVALCKELIARCCLPGQYMLDCCMGSGAIIEAGVQMKVLSLGCELGVESYAAAVARMNKYSKDSTPPWE